tara:strand:+ start:2975 stop:3931 length:957 start_codon:yes stop_codon:yes gene_type:complete
MAVKIKSKKAIIFTLIGIILSAIIILTFSLKTEYTLKNKMQIIKTRITTLDSFVSDVEDDLSRGMYIIGYNSLLAIEDHISANGTYLTDVDSTFEEAFLESTVDGKLVDILVNNTFIDWTDSIIVQANKVGIVINFSIQNITLSQLDPWELTLKANVLIDARDEKGTSAWEKQKAILATIPITGFEDPLYTLETAGRIINSIEKTNITDFSNTDDLVIHINNSYYKASTTAPSFLMRLQGNTSASEFGIESITNLNEFSAQGLQIFDRSNIDYIYFSNPVHSNCKVNQTSSTDLSWFKIDNDISPLDHLDIYGLQCEG